jgi:hypothetical protein
MPRGDTFNNLLDKSTSALDEFFLLGFLYVVGRTLPTCKNLFNISFSLFYNAGLQSSFLNV